MNRQVLLRILFVGTLLAGTPGTPVLAQAGDDDVEDVQEQTEVSWEDEEILATSPAEVARLWQRLPIVSEIDLPPSAAKYRAGCAAFSYIIEGNGSVSTVRMLHAYPRREVGTAVVNWVKQWKFEPTRDNMERLPVYTVQIYTVVVKNPDGSSGRVEDENELAAHCAVSAVRQ